METADTTPAVVPAEGTAPVEGAAPDVATEPEAAPEPTPEAAAPEYPNADEYAWGDYDPYAENWQDTLPEPVRPWADKMHGWYDARLNTEKSNAKYFQELYDASVLGSDEAPVVKGLQEKVTTYETQLQEKDARIAELEEQVSGSTKRYEDYITQQQTSLFDTFWDANGDAIKAADPAVKEAYKEIVDLDDHKNPDYVYLGYEETWKVAQAGKAEELKKLHADGVPASYAMQLLFPANAAPADTRPKPAATAEVVTGTDEAPSNPTLSPAAPKKEVPLSQLPWHERRVEAVRRARAKVGR